MNGLSVFEVRYVVESTLARFVRNVQTHAPVEAQHEELEVVTDSDTSAKGHLLESVF